MPDRNALEVALLTQVFTGEDAEARLTGELEAAAAAGADLALLPELPLQGWCPATRETRDADTEKPEGRRHQILSRAAGAARIGLVGGVIERDPKSGRRTNTALVHDASGGLVAAYRKLHLPDEPGYWEAHHYEPGAECARPIRAFPLVLGVQICSDINRPTGAQLLAAAGAEVIFVPRATPEPTYDRWRLVMRAVAAMNAVYVISVNRPRRAEEPMIGGPSLVIDPFGRCEVETEDPLARATLHRRLVELARAEYPGYLAHQAAAYTTGWQRAVSCRDPTRSGTEEGP